MNGITEFSLFTLHQKDLNALSSGKYFFMVPYSETLFMRRTKSHVFTIFNSSSAPFTSFMYEIFHVLFLQCLRGAKTVAKSDLKQLILINLFFFFRERLKVFQYIILIYLEISKLKSIIWQKINTIVKTFQK